MMSGIVFLLHGWQAILVCLLFSLLYVGSLYIGPHTTSKNRDHHDTIRQRFISVTIVSAIVPPILWSFSTYSSYDSAHTLFQWIGLRFFGFLPAAFIPLVLTMILFAGPLTMHYYDGVFMIYLERRYWTTSIHNITWIRNHIVAPLTEEFIYRACMLPLLFPVYGFYGSVFLSPLFFGIAHLHHMVNKVIHEGESVLQAFKEAFVQLLYTSIFGAYSSYLFLRTGHLIAPVIAHSFCNHMGFPAFNEIWAVERPKKLILISSFVGGFLGWLLLSNVLTTPWIYSNNVYT